MKRKFVFLLLAFLPVASYGYIAEGPAYLGLVILLSIMLKGALLGSIYLLPGLVALFRHAENERTIFLVNVFTAWSLVGWVACLFWALSSRTLVVSHASDL